MLYIILAGVILLQCFFIYNLLKTVEKHEENLEEIYERLARAYSIIKIADIRGSFESDDEVGDSFKILRTTMEYISSLIHTLDEEETDTAEVG